MKAMIEGNPKELTDFITLLQSQQEKNILSRFIPEDSDGIKIDGEKKAIK